MAKPEKPQGHTKEKQTTYKFMDKNTFAFTRTNFILLAIGMAIVIIGFILMSGSGSDETTFNAAIFSARRIKVAPVTCLIGFVFMIYAIMYKPRHKGQTIEKQDGNE